MMEDDLRIIGLDEDWWYEDLVTYCNLLVAYFGAGCDAQEALSKKICEREHEPLGLTTNNIGPAAIRSAIFSKNTQYPVKPPLSLRYVPFWTIWSCLEACHRIHLRKVSAPKVKFALTRGRRPDKKPASVKDKNTDNMEKTQSKKSQLQDKHAIIYENDSLSTLANLWLFNPEMDIVTISSVYGHPPFSMARSVLMSLFPSWNSKKIRDFMNRTICDSDDQDKKEQQMEGVSEFEAAYDDRVRKRLEKEIRQAKSSDPVIGPTHDRRRRQAGMKYEDLLQRRLKEFGVPFETEEDLRVRGTAKTPDILLSFPVAIRVPKIGHINQNKLTKSDNIGVIGTGDEWKMINWIDSKAMFGDVHTHHTDVVSQAEGYIHRFGPGLILYWFGHAPLTKLDNCHGDIVVTGWNIPLQIMLPTSEVVRYGDVDHDYKK